MRTRACIIVRQLASSLLEIDCADGVFFFAGVVGGFILTVLHERTLLLRYIELCVCVYSVGIVVKDGWVVGNSSASFFLEREKKRN